MYDRPHARTRLGGVGIRRGARVRLNTSAVAARGVLRRLVEAPMTTRTDALGAIAFLLLIAGCAPQKQPVMQAQDGAVALSQPGTAQSVPYAPAGTAFNAKLDQPINTQISNPGDAITATLMEPIRASNGAVLIDAGTKLHGKVTGIDRTNGTQIQLVFDSVALTNGDVPIGLRVVSAQESRYQSTPMPSGVANTQPSAGAAQRGQTAPQPTEQVTMSKGAVLRLSLTRPIVSVQSINK
jgi:hypothetical protein